MKCLERGTSNVSLTASTSCSVDGAIRQQVERGESKGGLTAGEKVPATNFKSMVNAGNLREGGRLNS